MKLYPLMVCIEEKLVVIIGGGAVALRKAKDLVRAGASVKIISPQISPGLRELALLENIQLIERGYCHGDLHGAALVFSTSDNSSVNRAVFNEAEKMGVFINGADDPENSNFHVPSSVTKGDFIFTLSTGGSSPAMAARLRREFESRIPENIEIILVRLREARELLKNREEFSDYDSPRRGDILRHIANDDSLLKSIESCDTGDKMILFLTKINM